MRCRAADKREKIKVRNGESLRYTDTMPLCTDSPRLNSDSLLFILYNEGESSVGTRSVSFPAPLGARNKLPGRPGSDGARGLSLCLSTSPVVGSRELAVCAGARQAKWAFSRVGQGRGQECRCLLALPRWKNPRRWHRRKNKKCRSSSRLEVARHSEMRRCPPNSTRREELSQQ